MAPSTKKRFLRIAALLAATGGIFLWLKLSGTLDDLSAERIRGFVEEAGPFGFLLFVVIFVVGELVHLPGMIFVAAGILAFGRTTGFFVSLTAAVCSVGFSFFLVRTLGGKALTEIQRPFVKRMLEKLDDRPITTVLVLRSIFWLAPPLNYALALSSIKSRDYLIGSTLGLVVPVFAATFFFDWLFT